MDVSSGTKRIVAVTGIALALFWAVALSTASPTDWPFDASKSIRAVANYSGPLGSFLAWTVVELFGRAFAWLVPLWVFVLGAATMVGWLRGAAKWVFKTAVAVVLLGALFALTSFTSEITALHGSVGHAIASALTVVLGEIGSTIVLIAVVLLLALGELSRLGALRYSDGGSPQARRRIAGAALRLPVTAAVAVGGWVVRAARWSGSGLVDMVRTLREAAAEEEPEPPGSEAAERPVPEAVESARPPRAAESAREFSTTMGETGPWTPPGERETVPIKITTPEALPSARAGRRKATATSPSRNGGDAGRKPLEKASLPPLSLLEHGVEIEGGYSHDTLKNWSGVLEDKLLNYGVEGRVSAVHHGPVVTTFEFEPAKGVRIKDITSRADDLALAMRARSLRMIAPIPGRAAVGIEIPNPESRIVYLYDVLSKITERQRLSGIMLGLGVDVVGKPFLMNLCDAPHLLIAGTTGSGKSVCLNAILSCILFQYRPGDVQILLVDPKMIEMAQYDGIPHLLHPVINDPKEAARVLEYLTAEMTRRNELFRRHGVKNIESYNSKVALGKIEGVDEEPERLPYIVLIVDELGDLALAKGVDIETLLARLAQMARAAGIHMVLATQRPSVDVIVGKTKANFPTRIAFRVATKVDSRTILDTIGADKLLGKGDMLYTDAHNPVPLRLHGAWVSEKNLEELIAHWKAYEFEESSLELQTAGAGSAEIDGDLDPLFDDARGVVVQFKQGSTSLLQRKLHIGYARAARLLDQLEQSGIVGPPDGSRPREVYIDSTEEAME
jgi:S-DNA-T family DNA segregation ATPase FtsK/SpoIIIE